jgi:hypothetical protein
VREGRENFCLAKKSCNPLINHDSDEGIQGRKSNVQNVGFSQRNRRSPRKSKRTEDYSVADAVFAFVSLRWRLKSLIEANLNVPSLVSASIEPSEKIL